MDWTRGSNPPISPNFKAKEFECHCGICSRQLIMMDLIGKLEEIRMKVNDIRMARGAQPIGLTITSGYRCNRYQQILAAKGLETATGVSQHEMGMAADITCDDRDTLKEVVYEVMNNYSIGEARSFFHVDMRTGGRRWSYAKS